MGALVVLQTASMACGVWFAAQYFALREGLDGQARRLADVEEVSRDCRRHWSRLSYHCQEMGIRVAQASLRAGRAESMAAGYLPPRSSTLDSFSESIERAAAALPLPPIGHEHLMRLEPLRFAPRPSSLVCVRIWLVWFLVLVG